METRTMIDLSAKEVAIIKTALQVRRWNRIDVAHEKFSKGEFSAKMRDACLQDAEEAGTLLERFNFTPEEGL